MLHGSINAVHVPTCNIIGQDMSDPAPVCASEALFGRQTGGCNLFVPLKCRGMLWM